MPIKFGEPPEGGMADLRAGISNVDNSGIGSAIPRGDDGEDSRAIFRPIRVYEITVDQVSLRVIPEELKPISWLYLVADNGQVFESAEVVADAVGGSAGFSHVNRGEGASSIGTALKVIEELDVASEGDFELGILRISSLFLNCIWLKSDKSGDQFFPFAPVFNPLVAYQKYSEDELFDSLTVLAETRRKFNDMPDENPDSV